MEYREVEVTLISAQNLKKVNAFGKMTVYGVAWIYPNMKVSSPMDTKGNLNPTWNATLKLSVDERLVRDGNAVLRIDLYNHGSFGNKHVGSSSLPLSGLLKGTDDKEEDKAGSSSSSSANFMTVPVMAKQANLCRKPQVRTYQAALAAREVLRPSGKAKGTLNVSVKLGELIAYPQQTDAPVVAYPGYGASQPYPIYQQAPYYPPGGYAPPPRRSGLGGGLGAGLVGGALGGLLLGSILGDGGGFGGCGGF